MFKSRYITSSLIIISSALGCSLTINVPSIVDNTAGNGGEAGGGADSGGSKAKGGSSNKAGSSAKGGSGGRTNTSNSTGGAENNTGNTTNSGGSAPTDTSTRTSPNSGGNPATGGAVNNGGSSQVGTTDPTHGGGGVTSTDTSTTAVGGSTSTPASTPPGEICGETSAGVAVAKGVACTDADQRVCYKACGPVGSGGYKSETCTAGSYVEVPQCIWTLADNSCYKVPAALADLDLSCPKGETPQTSQPCTIDKCISCTNSTNGTYLDSTGSAKLGWCTCDPEINVWRCGTTGTGWPCPGATGC